LRSIVTQDYPDIETIIVDGGSSDRTVEIAKAYTDRIFEDTGTLGSATQTAIDHSAGEVIAIFDDDIVIPHRGWLRHVVQYFNYSERVSTVWPMVVAPPNAALTTRLYNNIYKNNVRDRVSKQQGNCGGGNSLYLKQRMEDIGGIDRSIHWGLDYDWAKKLQRNGLSSRVNL
jgi:glycosyltransferase involved in cell wall biosynthesis